MHIVRPIIFLLKKVKEVGLITVYHMAVTSSISKHQPPWIRHLGFLAFLKRHYNTKNNFSLVKNNKLFVKGPKNEKTKKTTFLKTHQSKNGFYASIKFWTNCKQF